ncbi:uncharacterized protein LOC104584872 [Brachypodium distachyon]|uniref:Cathepsin propeptide inhibitor domain-containing protein n=1 Tax=Brachypodium distachyon TaxID=15368 RepID=A0A2K2CL78_BRADI|nr:uncharacterized protein LOC104584872 [Brachypodium distachyon]PNT62785.1 hypothetical protein BRADI_4g08160v3 [Brachypodium distachyon]|eukprot:XP_010238955.1 uncharacterized protein LOC104584872 [Brachypodium distachyon]
MAMRIWVVVTAMVCVVATAAMADMEEGDVGEYWQKRTAETRFKHGGPLHDLVSAATRYHQDLLGHRDGRRYLLAEEEAASAPTPPQAQAPASADGKPAGEHNTLADHDIVG